ncbi:MAG: hypothetical protein AABY45_04765 [Deltaproteobacteria bacterium]
MKRNQLVPEGGIEPPRDFESFLSLFCPCLKAHRHILGTIKPLLLDTALGNSSQLPLSKERIAVLSLLYTMVNPDSNKISKKIPATIAAIKNDNRAEAWYEIRYGSNRDRKHANRRYEEAHLFGLTDNTATYTDAEAKEILRMYIKHQINETPVQ